MNIEILQKKAEDIEEYVKQNPCFIGADFMLTPVELNGEMFLKLTQRQ